MVFTCAGDNGGNVGLWDHRFRTFDIWVNYYGDSQYPWFDTADFYSKRPGAKFPNYHYIYNNWPDMLAKYSSILLLDDDIQIDGQQIDYLFDTLDHYNLWLLQPSFSTMGKISHPINCKATGNHLRLTSFVEVNAPLFRKSILDSFMKVYDPKLIGYGVDYWYHHHLGAAQAGRVGIVDSIECINPCDKQKSGGLRAIDNLQTRSERIKCFEKFKQSYRISGDDKMKVMRHWEGYAQYGRFT